MRLCHIVPSLEGRHGGPSKSVRALANALAGVGGPVELLTTREAGQESPSGGRDAATIRTFPRVTPRWLSRSPELRRHLATTDCDLVHHHSVWLLTLRYAHEAARRQRLPLVISPRGMLSGWAYRHRRWRKRLAEQWVHPGAFTGAAGWHATSEQEAADIRALGFNQPVCVAPNGVTVPSEVILNGAREHWHRHCPAIAGRPTALFYGRFHSKKRLLELIDLWMQHAPAEWMLLLVGIPEEYSITQLRDYVYRSLGGDRIVIEDGSGRPAPYAAANLFLLPSHNENFGMVIAEALAAGVPALVTDGTPWQDLNNQGAGWCVPWEDYGVTLGRVLKEELTSLQAHGRRAREWVGATFSWERSAERLAGFYDTLHVK